MEENLKRNRRGFTLIELVIVIAVIGILTAILVPTFVNLGGQAKEANDKSLVTNLNKALAMAESEPEATANKTLQHAVDDLKQEGFNASILLSKSDQQLVWNSKTNRFLLSGEADKEIENGASPVDYFALVDSVPELSAQKYSMAPSAKWGGATEVTVKYSFDALEAEGIKQINYINTSKQNVILRSNSAGTNITLDPYVDPNDPAQGDHIDFYGSVGQITGPKDSSGNFTGFTVASHSLKINGKAIGLMAEKGHVDLTDAIVEEGDEIIILATTKDVEVSNPNKVATHAHASEDNAKAMNDPDDNSAKKSVGVTWDYDGNVAQNEIDDIHHHIALSEAEIASARENGTLGTGPVDGADSWNYSNTISKLIVEAVKKEMDSALGHDLIGTYCNRCNHPVADVKPTKNYTLEDQTSDGPQMKIYLLNDKGLGKGVSFFDSLGKTLYLDVAYCFKTFKDDAAKAAALGETNPAERYDFDSETQSFVKNQDGDYTAASIFDYFKVWTCDFFVSFDKDVKAYSCGLGGAYDLFGEVGFPAPDINGKGKIPAGEEIPLLGSVAKLGWTYESIAGQVGTFKCGFFNLSEDNVGTTFTVKLRITKPKTQEANTGLGALLDDEIDVAVIKYKIQAPSKENMKIAEPFMETVQAYWDSLASNE